MHQFSVLIAWPVKHTAYMLGSTLAHDWVVPATSCRKFWSYTIHAGHLYFMLVFAIMAWYAMRSAILPGWCGASTATYSAKHWDQVGRSGITFLVCKRSAAWTTSTCPSRDCGFFPLLGGALRTPRIGLIGFSLPPSWARLGTLPPLAPAGRGATSWLLPALSSYLGVARTCGVGLSIAKDCTPIAASISAFGTPPA